MTFLTQPSSETVILATKKPRRSENPMRNQNKPLITQHTVDTEIGKHRIEENM